MGLIAFAQVWPWCNATNPHLSHVPLDCFAVNRSTFSPQLHRNSAAAIERKLGVNLVNAMFECHFFCQRLGRSIVETRPAHTQQFRLDSERQFGLFPLD